MALSICKHLMFVCWMLLVDITVVFATKVNSLTVLGNSTTEKGSNLTVACNVVSWGSGVAVSIILDNTNLVSCIPSQCFTSSSGRYRYTTNSSSIFVNINPLTRGEDDGTWRCSTSGTGVNLQFVVYTSPTGIQFRDAPQQSQDLTSNNVNLICVTAGCTKPAPSFTFYYRESSGSRQSYPTLGVLSSESGSCTDSEMIYKSTLSLPRNTPFPGSVGTDKTVKFQCGITFTTLAAPMFTQETPDVRFAVQVTSVTLYNGASTPSSGQHIQVDNGVEKTLTCTTGTSRPAATIVWYIGTVKQTTTGTSFRFTPTNNDHDKTIYCKAYNTQPESEAVSSNTPKLLVRVQVTSVTLYNGASTPSSWQQIHVDSGVEKTLTCTSGTSRPAATIVWYIGTVKQTTTGSSFRFTPTNNDHDKTIYCKAYSTQPKSEAVSSNTPKLYVRVLAMIPTLSNQTTPGHLVLFSGDEVKLVCTSSVTRPKATVTWKKGTTSLGSGQIIQSPETGNLVSVTSVLTITPENGDNNKVIRCETRVSGQANAPSVQETIDVWWSPSPISIQPNFPWREDQTGNFLTCASSNYGNPTATANWTSQYGTPDDATRRLSFPQLSHVYDTKAVTCELSNGYTQRKGVRIISQTLNLDVQYRPLVTIKRNSVMVDFVTVNECQSLSALCTAVGNPNPTVRWTSKPTGGGLLQFTDIERHDDKPYICRASATSTKYPSYKFVTEKTLDIIVNFAPEVSADLATSSLEENSSVNIICNAAGRPATYTYTDLVQTWRDTGIPNTHSNLVGTERYRSLALNSLQLQDTGNYTCHVNNGINDRTGKLDQTGNVYLKVKVSPKIFPVQVNFAGAPGDTVNISIPFYSYPAAVGVTFTKQGGGPIQNGDRHTVSYPPTPVVTKFYGQDVTLAGNTAILQISNLQVEDFANYTLTISNSIGTKVQLYSLRSQSKPLPPKTFVYLGLFDGVPRFYWEQGFNGGHEQFFVIETTITGTDNWIKHEVIEERDQLYQQVNTSYTANITGLAPGQYSARFTAENKLGPIGVYDRPTVIFTIPEIHIPADTIGNNTAEIIGAFVGGVAFTIMVIAAVFIIRRQRKMGKCTCLQVSNTNSQHVEDAPTDQHVYYNMSTTGQTTEGITFKESDSDADTATYETTMSSNPSEHLYTDLMSSPQGVNKPQTNMEMYENLKLRTSR